MSFIKYSLYKTQDRKQLSFEIAKQQMQGSHLGVDLSQWNCSQLTQDINYTEDTKEYLHYIITSTQKAQKIPSFKSINRSSKKRLNQEISTNNKKLPFIPHTVQQICMKGLRTQYRDNLDNETVMRKQAKEKIPYFVRKKQNQKLRRKQLCILVKNKYSKLVQHFGNRIECFKSNGICPQISRKQILQYLNITQNDWKAQYKKLTEAHPPKKKFFYQISKAKLIRQKSARKLKVEFENTSENAKAYDQSI